MKRLTINQYGASSVMDLVEVDRPIPKAGEVLIEMHYSSVNPIDFKLRNGELKFYSGFHFPMTFGFDVTGRVVAKGKGANRFEIGDMIIALSNKKRGEAHAEYCTLDENVCVMAPEGISHEALGCLPLAGLTAYQGLVSRSQVKKGDRVLINGATGGVGHYACQIASYFDARVSAVCSYKNAEEAKRFGATTVYSYDKGENGLLKDYDIIFDVASNLKVKDAIRYLKPGGHYVATLPAIDLFLYMAVGLLRNRNIHFLIVKSIREDLQKLSRIVEDAGISTTVSKSFQLKDIKSAYDFCESGSPVGKVSLKLI